MVFFLKKIKAEIDKSLANQTKRKSKPMNETLMKGNDIIHSSEIQRITREYFENLSFKNTKNSIEIDKHLETYDLLKLNQEVTKNLSRSTIKDKTEAVITAPQQRKTQDQTESVVKCIKPLEIMLFKLVQKTKRDRMLSNAFYKPSITLTLKPDNSCDG